MSASQLLAIIIGVCQFLGIHQVLYDDSLISSTSSFLSISNMHLYSFLIAATPEVADLINEIRHDMVGDSTDTMWLDDPGGDYLDNLLGKSMDFSYEELSRIVLGLCPKM